MVQGFGSAADGQGGHQAFAMFSRLNNP